MSRLKVYSGGTGRLQLDSEEPVVDEHSDLARKDFQSGVLLYLDDGAGALRCRFLARRRSPEQFVAFYRVNEDSDVITDFRRTLEANLNRAKWRIDRDDEWTVQVLDAFGKASPGEPNDPIIRRVVKEYDRVDLGVPTEHAAVRLFEYCREVRDGPTIAVCAGKRPDHLDETEVVIQPSREHDSIVPIGRTEMRVRQDRIEEAFGELQSALTALDDALDCELDDEYRRRQLLATALRRSGVEGEKWTLVGRRSDSQLGSGVERVKSILGIDENDDRADEFRIEEVVDQSKLSALSSAATDLRSWTDRDEFRQAVEQLLEGYEIKIKDH